MWKARYVGPDGARMLQLPGTRLDEGNAYYLHEPSERLACAFCTAAVDYRAGLPSTVGRNRAGITARFALAAGAQHEESCAWPRDKARTRSRPQVVDRDLGKRVHLNTATFSALADGLPKPWPLDRERVTAQGIDDIVELIRKTPPEQLMDTVVVFGPDAVPWESFLIRYARRGPQARYVHLLHELWSGKPHACLLEIRTDKPAMRARGWPMAESQTIDLGVDKDGRRHHLVPKVRLANAADDRVTFGMTAPGAYLVLGVPELSSKTYRRSVWHRVTVTVEDRRQLARMSIEDIQAGLSASKPRRESGPSPGQR